MKSRGARTGNSRGRAPGAGAGGAAQGPEGWQGDTPARRAERAVLGAGVSPGSRGKRLPRLAGWSHPQAIRTRARDLLALSVQGRELPFPSGERTGRFCMCLRQRDDPHMRPSPSQEVKMCMHTHAYHTHARTHACTHTCAHTHAGTHACTHTWWYPSHCTSSLEVGGEMSGPPKTQTRTRTKRISGADREKAFVTFS